MFLVGAAEYNTPMERARKRAQGRTGGPATSPPAGHALLETGWHWRNCSRSITGMDHGPSGRARPGGIGPKLITRGQRVRPRIGPSQLRLRIRSLFNSFSFFFLLFDSIVGAELPVRRLPLQRTVRRSWAGAAPTVVHAIKLTDAPRACWPSPTFRLGSRSVGFGVESAPSPLLRFSRGSRGVSLLVCRSSGLTAGLDSWTT